MVVVRMCFYTGLETQLKSAIKMISLKTGNQYNVNKNGLKPLPYYTRF